jgi:uncharacterized protein (DUF4415 family)
VQKSKRAGAQKLKGRAVMTGPYFKHSAGDDAPELTKEFFERADWYRGNKLIRAGRPPSGNPKQALKLRIDADVVEHFRATGPGWQTRINDTLRKATKLPPRKYERVR